jgi:serine/threonine-protein kinase
MIGKTISHYKILEKLGEGGMGVVYRAEDTRLKRCVALKFLRNPIGEDSEEKVRLVREAQAVAALDHPNITTVYEIDETDDGQTFIAMAHVAGVSLKKKIKSGSLGVDEPVDIAIQIARGLKEAHDAGIVHRDIKSANVMVSSRGQVKITDFGLAKLKGERTLTQKGSQIGTASYMSPEQIRGENVDHQSDLFSFGVVLYEMLARQLPFKGEDSQAQMFSIVYDAPESLTSFRPGLPTELRQIVERALEKKKELRYPSIDELLDDLQGLRGKATSGHEISIHEEKVRRRRRLTTKKSKNIYLYGGITVVLIAIVFAIAFYTRGIEKRIDSLAVLPFVNVGEDPNMEYLSDGITESLIFRLSQLPNLKVIAPSSVLRYKGQEYDIQEVAHELDVQAVLAGRLVVRGNELSISAEFVKAEDNSLLWGEHYNRRLTGILDVQEELIKEIAKKLQPHVTNRQIIQLTKRYTDNVEVYQLYLKGRYFWNKRTDQNIKKAMDFFQQAIKKDSSYSLAYTGLADCYSMMPWYSGWSPHEAYPKAKSAALKALELDSELAEGYTSLAFVKHHYEWDWPAARSDLKRAVNLKPGYAMAHFLYGIFSGNVGHVKESIRSIRRAQELDPLSPNINTNFGDVLSWARRYDEAIEQYKKTLELAPDFFQTNWGLGKAYLQKGMYEEAIEVFKKSGSREIAYAYMALGRRDEALSVLKEQEKRSTEGYVDPMFFAKIYYSLGEIDLTFHALEEAYQVRSPKLIDEIYCEPFYDGLRTDPRYKELLNKMKLGN